MKRSAPLGLEDPDLSGRLKPFGVPWLDSCYQETLLPSAPWHQLSARIERSFISLISRSKQLNHPQRRQAIFQQLGLDFVKKHFPMEDYDPLLLEPPKMTQAQKERVLHEAQTWLWTQLYTKTCPEVHAERVPPGSLPKDNTCDEMLNFLEHSHRVFKRGLDRHLYLQEQEIINKKRSEFYRRKAAKDAELFAQRMLIPSRLKPRFTVSSDSSRPSTKPPKTAQQFVDRLQKGGETPPEAWGPHSNSIGRTIVGILKRDPRRFDQVAATLKGRQLPATLRAYIYADVLYRKERRRLKDISVEKVVRERFGRAVARGVGELKVKKATESPIKGLIENAVTEMYNKTPCMQVYNMPRFVQTSTHALNILYVFDRTYEPYLIHWMFPLQLAFKGEQQQDEHMYELALYTELLNATCFPRWPEVFAVSETVMDLLKVGDPQLHRHLNTICHVRANANPQDFLVQVIHREKDEAERLMAARGNQDQALSSLLHNPLVFIRKWIGEGFVSVLDYQAVMFVWDQCFLQSWNNTVLMNVALVLILLLKHRFLEARDYMGMRSVFLDEPCALYTRDIQRAWNHLERGGHPRDIPAMNRQRPDTLEPAAGDEKTPTPAPAAVRPDAQTDLPAIGVKDLQIQLNITPDSKRKDQFIQNFDASTLSLRLTLYFGSISMGGKSAVRGTAKLIEASEAGKYGQRQFLVQFAEQRFEFDPVDTSQFDVEKELGGYPFAIVELLNNFSDGEVTVGWTKLSVFKHVGDFTSSPPPVPSSRSSQQVDHGWLLEAGRRQLNLNPGSVPAGMFSLIPETPAPLPAEDLLSNESQLLCLVYDPFASKSRAHSQRSQRAPSRVQPSRTEDDKPVSTKPEEPWVRTVPAASKNDPLPQAPGKPFDFYIDSVRFIPDNATIVKVTGRILKIGRAKTLPDVLAVPELTSSARCPRFKYRITINEEGKEMDAGCLALIRAYTVDRETRELVVIGSCLVPFYDNSLGKDQLRVGGHQVRLRSGMPENIQTSGIAGLKPGDMDSNELIPACSILYRIMPHSKSYKPSPEYSSGYYQSAAAKPSRSEERVMHSFLADSLFEATVQASVNALQKAEQQRATSGAASLDWLKDRLDGKKHLPDRQPAPDLEVPRAVRYRQKHGIYVKIQSAHGLEMEQQYQCVCVVNPGQETFDRDPVNGWGWGEHVTTAKLDVKSLQSAPHWDMPAQVLHPFYDDYSTLVVLIIGTDFHYKPSSKHTEQGQMKASDGRTPPSLQDHHVIGWAVVPLFDWGSVFAGEHHVPVFRGEPNRDLLEELQTNTLLKVLPNYNWDESNSFETGVLVIETWDGHFTEQDRQLAGDELQVLDALLEQVGDPDAYAEEMEETAGPRVDAFVLGSLTDKESQRLGREAPAYSAECEFWPAALDEAFGKISAETEWMKKLYNYQELAPGSAS